MKITQLELGPIGTNAYLLIDETLGEAVLIDAPLGAANAIYPLLQEANAKLTTLILTHGHWDHTQGAAELQRQQVEIWAHQADQPLIETPEVMRPYLQPGIVVEAARIDRYLPQGEVVRLLGRNFEIRHVPGHCPGNILIYCADLGVAFVGDVIFRQSVGRYDLPGGDFEQLEQSIRQQVYTLPEETVLLSGHGPQTTVGYEKKHNPFIAER